MNTYTIEFEFNDGVGEGNTVRTISANSVRSKMSTQDLFAQAKVGLGASYRCGSDCYGYFIASVDPKTKTIGIYTPKHWFRKSWTDGDMEHEPFDPTRKPDTYLQAWRGRWYRLDEHGKRQGKRMIHIGHCHFYQDPSF